MKAIHPFLLLLGFALQAGSPKLPPITGVNSETFQQAFTGFSKGATPEKGSRLYYQFQAKDFVEDARSSAARLAGILGLQERQLDHWVSPLHRTATLSLDSETGRILLFTGVPNAPLTRRSAAPFDQSLRARDIVVALGLTSIGEPYLFRTSTHQVETSDGGSWIESITYHFHRLIDETMASGPGNEVCVELNREGELVSLQLHWFDWDRGRAVSMEDPRKPWQQEFLPWLAKINGNMDVQSQATSFDVQGIRTHYLSEPDEKGNVLLKPCFAVYARVARPTQARPDQIHTFYYSASQDLKLLVTKGN